MPRILLVDDEAAILGMLRAVLEPSGFEVQVARSAAEAQKTIRENSFDVVLTDMRMESPRSGYDVVRAACQLPRRPAIAILTAFPIPAHEWRPSGADALLIKGSDVLKLPETLLSLIRIQAQKESAAAKSQLRRSG
jgi:CheY-like chemotaxis protein